MSRGILLGLSAYLLWGLSPLYWKLLDHLSSADVVIHRILATGVVLALAHTVLRTWRRLGSEARNPRTRTNALLAGTMLAANWLVFVWAVANDQVVETSLGYFINPLLSVVLGVAVLGEHMRRLQWIAVGIAALGVVVLTIDVGTLPWVSLALAGTFGVYGLVRKTSPVGSLDGLSLEMAAMAPFALVALAVRGAAGEGIVGLSDPGLDLLLLGTGVVTAAPLLLFASAARTTELSTLGLMQYVAPTIQFLLGVIVFGEEWSGGQALGFVIIWSALALFAAEGFARARQRPRPIATHG